MRIHPSPEGRDRNRHSILQRRGIRHIVLTIPECRLFHTQARTRAPRPVHDTDPGPICGLRVRRGLLQPPASPLHDRDGEPGRVREGLRTSPRPRGMQETWQKTLSHSSIRRTSSLPSTRQARKCLLAPLDRHPRVLEEGAVVGKAATLTPSRARCFARVRELIIISKRPETSLAGCGCSVSAWPTATPTFRDEVSAVPHLRSSGSETESNRG